jgi:FkbM family methyltransferase
MLKLTHDLKVFYSKLQDEESRTLFKAWFLRFLDENDEHIWKFIDTMFENGCFSGEISELIKLQRDGFEIVLYGAGHVGKAAYNYFERHGLVANFFCDKNPKKQNTEYMKLPIISLQNLTKEHKNVAIVITTSSVWVDEIKKELENIGLAKHIYDFFVNYQICGYFDYDFLKPVKNEIYIDCGVLDGGTIKEFSDFTNGRYNKIYGFEPDDSSYRRTLNNLQEQKILRVEMINKGVWSEETELSFIAKGDGGSCIIPQGQEVVSVTTIDHVVGNDFVTFIKMDIEGSELEALHGAAKTIQRTKPRLAICIYHKPEDILGIPLYIQSLVPEYKYYIRQQAVCVGDLVLFALAD